MIRTKPHLLLGFLAAVAVAGCSQGEGTTALSATDAAADAAVEAAMAAAPAGSAAALAAPVPGAVADQRPDPFLAMDAAPRAGFASAPDRGDLVAYPDKPVVRREGPYTWHRADISEAHALGAMLDGVLSFTAPSGEQLRFQFDRHVEHASGDWTWIGHLVGGSVAENAILTFGSDAVFGTIAVPGAAALSLTMQDGASWLIETDRAALAARSKATGRYAKPDFIVPTATPDAPASLGLSPQAMAPAMSQAASAPVVVDVLVAYTDGFDALWRTGPGNNTPIANTRINNLVAIANQSYANAQVDLQVRLVHTTQVTYPDATNNSDALSALTGSDGSYTPVLADVDPVLKPLHAARDLYGADLVVLIRRFNHPENVSCGVAWLIGGGQSFTHAGYAVYGFSVVSDGNDGQYYCEDTTFAHELGHNMGLAHDVETAQGDDGALQSNEYGRYSYSFGYRTGPLDGHFYTVMAYSDDQVIGYKVFSNPRVTVCGGFQCGVLNQADNARTLEQTTPIIASFRATTEPPVPETPLFVKDDFNGDGHSDLTWRNDAQTHFAYWLMDGPKMDASVSFKVPSQWSVVAKGDFNGDSLADVVWTNGTVLQLWAGTAQGGFTSTRIARVPNGWSVFGAGDVDGDGKSDLVWRNNARTQAGYWRMDGDNVLATTSFGAGPAWDLRVVADTGGDGMADLAWTNGSRVVVWTSNGSGFVATTVRSQPSGWTLVDGGDVDGDGNSDLHWRTDAQDRYAFWRMDGATYLGASAFNVAPAWTLAAVGDYNGDGFADLTWYNNDRVVQWMGDGQGTFGAATVRKYPAGWTLLR